MITVEKRSNQEFIVTVKESGSSTKHIVTLDDNYYYKLTKGKVSKEELIRSSFGFLLTREAKESILSKFSLKIISNYFPEYEEKIKIQNKKGV